MTAAEHPESTPPPDGTERPAEGMGVSSERIGHTGPGQEGTTGVKEVRAVGHGGEVDLPPEQHEGHPEPNPVGLEPKAGYPSVDPRSERKPYHAPEE